ncbi:MAG: dTMP kinase [Deltaproteobacteria bacterium]|jgi:dTMP kinase|nr:MAG: dTMP kinase [Deltaproteobacteria bacterium]
MSTEDFQASHLVEQDSTQESPLLIPGGLFIVFEGIDGTGKSTQLHLLAEKLRQLGYAVVATREPTSGPFGQKIRELFVDRGAVSQEEELELFIADRDQHVKEVITPALADGCVVICDRYYLSTIAYQGANGMDPDIILKKNEDFPVPDLAVILEIDPAHGINRIRNQRNENPNTFEDEANLQKVASIFAGMQQDFIERINGSESIEKVHSLVLEAVTKVLAQKTTQHVDS